ncbi:DUF2865 domain-containing protein [Beijerinckia sp. L45]|uniref:DUF2865 domain-containing protein n=1 Tax=Beijerinckia sp. L45 TaxID=1641855 RepID=UPI00131A66B6|nr:DUF2865 domain-containing protein [Beijerinckia sp. L45]
MRDTIHTFLFRYGRRRFGSKAARFKTAVATGFIVATIGFLAGGPVARPSIADDGIFGAMSTLFGGFAERREPAMVANPILPRAHRHRREAALHNRRPVPTSGTRTMCVRLCDGYAFPVGIYHGKGDDAAHQATCQASCPDAKTALYVLPRDADQIGAGINVATGQNYSKLPDAFHYTTVLDDACTCHRDGVDGKALSLLHDFTLRRGDAVMTPRGVRIFHGSGHFPYRRTDFLALTRSRDVGRANRDTMRAIERASINAAPSRTTPVLSQGLPSNPPVIPGLKTVATPLEPADRG